MITMTRQSAHIVNISLMLDQSELSDLSTIDVLIVVCPDRELSSPVRQQRPARKPTTQQMAPNPSMVQIKAMTAALDSCNIANGLLSSRPRGERAHDESP
jgi:hypothetical protein